MANILIIDDDKAICTVFERMLTLAGHSTKCAENGRTGLELLRQHKPDLVITDIMMPEIDGLEVIMAIKGNWEGIPVIAISGGPQIVSMDFLPVAKVLGACKVLYKPIGLQELLSAVVEMLDEPHPDAIPQDALNENLDALEKYRKDAPGSGSRHSLHGSV